METRHLQGGNRPVIFDDTYESRFLPGPHYEVWISRAPLFGQMEGDDSPYAMLNWHCSGKPSKTSLDRHKHQGPLSSLLFLNLYNLYPSHMNLHLPRIAVIIGFLCSSIPRVTARNFWTRVTLYPKQTEN